jgi:peroxiredoxin
MLHDLSRWLTLALLLAATNLQAATLLSAVAGRPEAPDFTLTDLNGKPHRLSDYKGKVVVVNFWATWCPPCREEMPALDRAAQALGRDGILVLGVASGETKEKVVAFQERLPVGFPLLPDPAGKVMRGWPGEGLPNTFVVDRRGRIAYAAGGKRVWDDPQILAPIRLLLDEREFLGEGGP